MFDEVDDILYDADLGFFPEDSLDEAYEYDEKDVLLDVGFNVDEFEIG